MRNYLELGNKIIEQGDRVETRTGFTRSLTGESLSFNMADGFPMLTTKYINPLHIKHEVLWYLMGTTSIEYLQNNNIHIWDNWADEYNDIGKTYGYQWRRFNGDNHLGDQYKNAINLLKMDPFSRRILINGWNPLELHEMNLPPCIINLHLIARPDNKLDLVVYQRSADFCLGVPYDIAEMALLLHMICAEVDMIPNKLTITYGDVHVYENHIDTFKTVQAIRTPSKLPTLNPDWSLTGYEPQGKIAYKISV